MFRRPESGAPGAGGAEFRKGRQTGEGEGGQTQSEEAEPGGDNALAVWPQGGASDSGNQIRRGQETVPKEEGKDRRRNAPSRRVTPGVRDGLRGLFSPPSE